MSRGRPLTEKNTQLSAKIDQWLTQFSNEYDKKIGDARKAQEGLQNYLFRMYEQEIAKLPQDLLNMKFTDFVKKSENEPQPESPVPKGRCKKSPLFGTEVAGRLLRNTRARENRELNGTVLRPPPTTTRGLTLGSTVKRPPKSRRELVANTPMGQVRLPPRITPKVQNGADLHYRAMKPGELTFSVTGTPVLADGGSRIDDDAQQIAQMLKFDEAELTPETRSVVYGLKTVIRRMHNADSDVV